MAEKKVVFRSWRSFDLFATHVRKKFRFVQSREIRRFLETLLATSVTRVVNLDPGLRLLRAQRGCDEVETEENLTILPFKPDRMIPRADRVRTGRTNPAGIAYLYLADTVETAISEVRPWLHEQVSLAHFRTTKPLKVVDFSKWEKETRIYFVDPKDPDVKEREVWASLCRAFSRPVGVEDQELDYIPTQIISEYFRSEGFDGIKYKSLVAPGNNYALFDVRSAIPEVGTVYEIRSLTYEVSEASNPVEYLLNENGRRYNTLTGFRPVDRAGNSSTS